MKLKLIAVVLPFLVLSLPVHSETTHAQQAKHENHSVAPKQINLNTADATQLTGSIKGIGKKRAQAIIKYREEHHGFKSIEELAEVKGIGSRFMAKNQKQVKALFVVN
jgi:competence protein ComEA